jgi:hypothetical protein
VASLSELLVRHRPLLRYDSQDPFHACSTLTVVENPHNKLVSTKRGTIAVANDAIRMLSLESLRGDPDTDGQRLDENGDERKIQRDAVRMQEETRYADRVYGRPVQRDGMTYLQYWFWFYYNPKDVAGRGRHEGDWEMIQLRLEGEQPKCAVYAQHDHAFREDWANIRRHPAPDGPHPVVYVAAESHASYFQDGTHPSFGRADNAYGDGKEVLPQLDDFGEWVMWHGRWGNSKGIFAWVPIIRIPPTGTSPKSPGHQNPKWDDPPKFERDAKDNTYKEERLLWRLGTNTYPLRPEILDAQVSGTRVVVRYRLRGRLLFRRARHLLVTVNAPDERGDVLGRCSRINAPSEGKLDFDIVRVPDRAVVLASAFNRRRQRSKVAIHEVALK